MAVTDSKPTIDVAAEPGLCKPVCKPTSVSAPNVPETSEPFGEVGFASAESAFECRCGAGPHPTREDRCANGHTKPGHAGPLAASDRERRAHAVWNIASNQVTTYLRLIDLRRVPKAGPTLDEYLAAHEELRP